MEKIWFKSRQSFLHMEIYEKLLFSLIQIWKFTHSQFFLGVDGLVLGLNVGGWVKR